MSCISLYTCRQLWLICSKICVKSQVKGQASVMFSMLLRLNVTLLNGNHHKHHHEVVIRSALIPGLNSGLWKVQLEPSQELLKSRIILLVLTNHIPVPRCEERIRDFVCGWEPEAPQCPPGYGCLLVRATDEKVCCPTWKWNLDGEER